MTEVVRFNGRKSFHPKGIRSLPLYGSTCLFLGSSTMFEKHTTSLFAQNLYNGWGTGLVFFLLWNLAFGQVVIFWPGGKMSESIDKKQAKADAKAEKAREKAMRPWFKKKRFIIPLGIVAIVILATIVNGGGSGSSPEPTATTQSEEEAVVATEDAVEEVVEEVVEDTEAEIPSDETTGERNARLSAEDYLAFSAFSYSGLIAQLVFEGYSTAEAEYAVDAVNPDWMQQAALSAQQYLEFSAFSESGLAEQLEFEGFTPDEAAYGVANSGADWMEQAAKSAEQYLEFSSFSRSGLIEQLVFEGFTQEQAEYGVSQNGY